ncbi:MAG: cell division protein FtsA [Zetaproteobacteria bacterium]|nr:MAG: cell division protein FtsA [Zetaproteobacteria bacterium]
MSKHDQLLIGLDIGTSKIACIVAEANPDGKVDIIGIGTNPSKGLRKGVVVNIESTVESIRRAVEEAELMAGVQIHSVFTGIAGSHIRGYNSHGVVATKNNEVGQEDVDRVIDAAKAMNIPADQQILHILPQEYIIDNQDGIREPIGMNGVRLEAKVHIVTAAVSSIQNIIKCCNRCDLDVADMVLEQVASSEAVLSQDEKDIGVALIDIGGGTTDIAVFLDGAIRHTAVIPIGGDHLTNDLVIGLRTSAREADELKRKYGCCLTSMVPPEEQIEIPSVGGRPPRPMPRQVMAQILEPRMEELFEMVKAELERSGYQELLAAGLVITGGSALLDGVIELAEDVFEIPVRLGRPQGVGGLTDVVSSPMYATGVGLILYGYRYRQQHQRVVRKKSERGLFARAWHRLRSWFGDTA